MNKSWLVGIVLVALIAGETGLALKHHSSVTPPVGAVTGPDSFFDCETHNGIQRCFTRKGLVGATTTPCAIKSPAATSTLIISELRINVGTSTATTWTAATSTTAFATTTLFVPTISLASGAQGTMTAATTTLSNNPDNVFKPNTWLVWGVAGINNVVDATKLTGICQATFETI